MENKNLEIELWTAFRQGDKYAFGQIYEQNISKLLNYGSKITFDKTLIEDSIQDLFYELWNSRSNLSATDSIKFYLFKALRNKIIRNRNKIDFEVTDNFLQLSDLLKEMPQESYMMAAEEKITQTSQLKSYLDQLPKRQQEAINLRFYHDFSNEEIAQIMGVNYQSACKFIYMGIKSLKENMKIFMLIALIISQL